MEWLGTFQTAYQKQKCPQISQPTDYSGTFDGT